VEDSKKKPGVVGPYDALPTGERRRLGRIVHDDRGNASVEWEDAPPDYERPVLEIEGQATSTGGLSIKPDETFDPYARTRTNDRKSGNTTRTDLRKLSEWIKLTRELEEKKNRGGDDEE
jgi:hypothetical protein